MKHMYVEYIFGAFYYLSMYKQNNKNLPLKKRAIFSVFLKYLWGAWMISQDRMVLDAALWLGWLEI